MNPLEKVTAGTTAEKLVTIAGGVTTPAAEMAQAAGNKRPDRGFVRFDKAPAKTQKTALQRRGRPPA
jgi:hypothetical protein